MGPLITALAIVSAPYLANNSTAEAFPRNYAITPATSLGPSNREVAEKLCAA